MQVTEEVYFIIALMPHQEPPQIQDCLKGIFPSPFVSFKEV